MHCRVVMANSLPKGPPEHVEAFRGHFIILCGVEMDDWRWMRSGKTCELDANARARLADSLVSVAELQPCNTSAQHQLMAFDSGSYYGTEFAEV